MWLQIFLDTIYINKRAYEVYTITNFTRNFAIQPQTSFEYESNFPDLFIELIFRIVY